MCKKLIALLFLVGCATKQQPISNPPTVHLTCKQQLVELQTKDYNHMINNPVFQNCLINKRMELMTMELSVTQIDPYTFGYTTSDRLAFDVYMDRANQKKCYSEALKQTKKICNI